MTTDDAYTRFSSAPARISSPARSYSGRSTADSRAPIAVRIERAVRQRHGEIDVGDFTTKQLAALWRVPLHLLIKALKNGGNGSNGNHAPDPVARQLKSFQSLTAEQQVAFFRNLGPDWALELAAAADTIADNELDLFAPLKSERV